MTEEDKRYCVEISSYRDAKRVSFISSSGMRYVMDKQQFARSP